MAIVEIDREGIARTLSLLKSVGQTECVVLWLGRRVGDAIKVQCVYLPKQVADFDYFHIPEESMSELLNFLRKNRLMVAAQVHTHPGRAFHSPADDEWAIIRHCDGLSLVVPCFAADTSPGNFMAKIVVYRLSERNQWQNVPPSEISGYYRVTP